MLWQLPTVFLLLRHVGGQYEQLARQLLEEECSEEARKDERLVEARLAARLSIGSPLSDLLDEAFLIS